MRMRSSQNGSRAQTTTPAGQRTNLEGRDHASSLATSTPSQPGRVADPNEAKNFLSRAGLTPRKPMRLPSPPRREPPPNIILPSPQSYRELSEITAATSASPSSSGTIPRGASPPGPAYYSSMPRTEVPTTVSNPHQLRELVLDQGRELKELSVRLDNPANTAPSQLQSHEVVRLVADRFHSGSTPGNRAKGDDAKLALCLEGGGMRGAVAAGMAAAIACLGLTDAFDAVFGSSAGSVIGAYLVSRQMCMDVYVDILPTAKRTFVCTKRMLSALAVNAVDLILSHLFRPKEDVAASPTKKFSSSVQPGMNISFVLDGVMDESRGIRPLDVERFKANDRVQPLRIVSSCVRTDGSLRTKCFGSEDFFPAVQEEGTANRSIGRRGIYACLEASMTVPGATGPPVRIKDPLGGNATLPFFDAFCFEPLPYRSAVEEGATHALVLCSRPEGFQPVTQPGVYERAVAPIYFRSHQQPQVGRFFERGGQQYIYAEDLLTLEEGKNALDRPVLVPPPRVLYGIDDRNSNCDAAVLAANRHLWKTAHLLPLKVPLGTPELPTLEQDRDTVLAAVRQGFAVAFDLFAPAIDLVLQGGLTGADVADLIFPGGEVEEDVLDRQIRVVGDSIAELGRRSTAGVALADNNRALPLDRRRSSRRLSFLRFLRSVLRRRKWTRATGHHSQSSPDPLLPEDGIENILLATLPGLRDGKMAHLSLNLRDGRNATMLLP